MVYNRFHFAFPVWSCIFIEAIFQNLSQLDDLWSQKNKAFFRANDVEHKLLYDQNFNLFNLKFSTIAPSGTECWINPI